MVHASLIIEVIINIFILGRDLHSHFIRCVSVVCPVWVVRSLIVCNRFEFLAFSSDVSHWRQKQELVGVSVRYEFHPY